MQFQETRRVEAALAEVQKNDADAAARLRDLEGLGDFNPDVAVQPTTPLYRQSVLLFAQIIILFAARHGFSNRPLHCTSCPYLRLVELVAEDQALSDAIFILADRVVDGSMDIASNIKVRGELYPRSFVRHGPQPNCPFPSTARSHFGTTAVYHQSADRQSPSSGASGLNRGNPLP